MKRSQAQALANLIRSYWQRLGVPVNVWVVSEHDACGRGREGSPDEYTVRSDLVNGLPQNVSATTFRELAEQHFQFSPAAAQRLPPVGRAP